MQKSETSVLDKSNIPSHIAVIMDGNGRWAKNKGENRLFGHQNGVGSVRAVTEEAARLGVKFLTLYAFSTENWRRPKEEVDGLMQLLAYTIRQETETLLKNNIRLFVIGDLDSMPKESKDLLNESMNITAANTGTQLNLALSYSSRWEMVNATKRIADDVLSLKISPEDINETLISSYLTTKNIPDPELLIRTSGEKRISNFLLWQLAYTELYFTETLWPDFREPQFVEAIIEFQQRERRFGLTSNQLQNKK